MVKNGSSRVSNHEAAAEAMLPIKVIAALGGRAIVKPWTCPLPRAILTIR
jgi:hypothetical protein